MNSLQGSERKPWHRIQKSVFTAYNQSRDIKTLFVVDGSSFVTAGTQNPTMTICALAMRASEYLADKLSKKEL